MTERTTPLDTFVLDIANGPARFPISKESQQIRDDVNKMSTGLVTSLAKEWRMFGGATLLRAGSMQNGLKIDHPDEFDFMIELPAMTESVITFETTEDETRPEAATYTIVDDGFIADIFASQYSQKDDDIYRIEYVRLFRMHQAITTFVHTYLETNLLEGWSIHPGHDPSVGVHFPGAITPYLVWSGEEFPSMTVSIDYTLAVPVMPQGNSAQPRPMHYILRGPKKCQLSCAMLEQIYWSKYELNSVPKQVIRSTKYLISNCSPRIYNASIQDVQQFVTSYAIQNVVFHQLDRKDDDMWASENLGDLVLRVLEELTDHYSIRQLQCYHMPGYNILHKCQDLDSFDETLEKYGLEKQKGGFVDEVVDELKRLCHLVENVRLGDQSSITAIKDLQRRNKEESDKHIRLGFEARVADMLYSYARGGYKQHQLDETKQFILANNLTWMNLTGEGKDVILSCNDRVEDLDEIYQEKFGQPSNYFPKSRSQTEAGDN